MFFTVIEKATANCGAAVVVVVFLVVLMLVVDSCFLDDAVVGFIAVTVALGASAPGAAVVFVAATSAAAVACPARL
jgi:hypothetical protein